MAATETAPEAYDALGRRRTCIVCRKPIHQPKTGRPRILCSRRLCRLTHRYALRRIRVRRGGKR